MMTAVVKLRKPSVRTNHLLRVYSALLPRIVSKELRNTGLEGDSTRPAAAQDPNRAGKPCFRYLPAVRYGS